jgi:hypothetical protein
MGVSFGSLLLAAAALVYAAYEAWTGYQVYKESGFRFFLISGIWTGAPFVVVAAVLLLLPERTFGGWEVGLLLVWLAVFPWKALQEHKARRQSPEQWARWIRKQGQSRKSRGFF